MQADRILSLLIVTCIFAVTMYTLASEPTDRHVINTASAVNIEDVDLSTVLPDAHLHESTGSDPAPAVAQPPHNFSAAPETSVVQSTSQNISNGQLAFIRGDSLKGVIDAIDNLSSVSSSAELVAASSIANRCMQRPIQQKLRHFCTSASERLSLGWEQQLDLYRQWYRPEENDAELFSALHDAGINDPVATRQLVQDIIRGTQQPEALFSAVVEWLALDGGAVLASAGIPVPATMNDAQLRSLLPIASAASGIVSCAEYGPCGPYSTQTLEFCGNAMLSAPLAQCAAHYSYVDALEHNMSPAAFQSAVQLSAVIADVRAGNWNVVPDLDNPEN